MDYEKIKDKLAPCGLHYGKCFAFKEGDIANKSRQSIRIAKISLALHRKIWERNKEAWHIPTMTSLALVCFSPRRFP